MICTCINIYTYAELIYCRERHELVEILAGWKLVTFLESQLAVPFTISDHFLADF